MDPYVSFKKSKGLIGFLCSTSSYYQCVETMRGHQQCKIYLVFKGLTFLVMWRTWHLEGLNCISHIFSHCSRHARSVFRTWPSVVDLIARYMAVSSAKSLTLD